MHYQPIFPMDEIIDFLPAKPLSRVPRRGLVYSPEAGGLYYISTGLVIVERENRNGHAVGVDVFKSGDFFGESSLITRNLQRNECARPLCDTDVMRWPVDEMLFRLRQYGALVRGLMDIALQRNAEFIQRLEDAALLVEDRLACELVRLSYKIGEELEDGSFMLRHLSHEALASLIGTSREIVTAKMGALRKYGMVRYGHGPRSELRVWPERLKQELGK